MNEDRPLPEKPSGQDTCTEPLYRSVWQQSGMWPRSTDRYIFLAEAVRMLGRRLYPNAWTDEENPYVGHEETRLRFRSAKERILTWARSGTIETFVTPEFGGGEIVKIPTETWLLPVMEAYFDLCIIEEDVVEEVATASPKASWIYLDHRIFMLLTSNLHVEPKAATSSGRIAARAWLRKRVRESPLFKTITKKDAAEYMIATFSLTETAASRVWTEVVNAETDEIQGTWSGRGPLKKKV